MASGTYTALTLAQATAELARRLYDPTHIRWSADELTIYIQQSLRTYNAYTCHFRTTASLTTTLAQPFYFLPTVAPSQRAQSYTVAQAVSQLCYHLMEFQPVGNVWAGTEQYSLPIILDALRGARDEFLRDTGIVVTNRAPLAVSPFPASGRVDLDESIIALRHVAWRVTSGVSAGITDILRRTDEWGLTGYDPQWRTASARPPKYYSVGVTPPLILQLAPFTTATGELHLLTIDRGAAPSLLIADQSLGVPNDWAWVVIYGALAELLSRDGLALDVQRAAYCQARWDHGVAAARNSAVVLNARIEDEPCQIISVSDADAYSTSWRMVPGVPRRLLTCGHTIIGSWPPPGVLPGGGNYSFVMDLVQNAPVPSASSDYLQVGPELIDGILAYAQHQALFKECGPGQVQGAQGLLDQFMDLCGTEIDLQRAWQPDRRALIDQTTQGERVIPDAVAADGSRA